MAAPRQAAWRTQGASSTSWPKRGSSEVAKQALQRVAWLYRIEQELVTLTSADRLAGRRQRSAPLWDELHAWLRLERARVPDGGGIASAIDYSLRRSEALGALLRDGDVAIDNNHLENQMCPSAMGRNYANPAFM